MAMRSATQILQEMVMKKLVVAVFALGFLTACSSEPSKPAQVEKPKPPEPITARNAFQKCYIAARNWARDAQPYRIESILTDDSKGREGKFGRARGFASQRSNIPLDPTPGRTESFIRCREIYSPSTPARGV
jgi:hypothetical protein